jgi:hypothetical protein
MGDKIRGPYYLLHGGIHCLAGMKASLDARINYTLLGVILNIGKTRHYAVSRINKLYNPVTRYYQVKKSLNKSSLLPRSNKISNYTVYLHSTNMS